MTAARPLSRETLPATWPKTIGSGPIRNCAKCLGFSCVTGGPSPAERYSNLVNPCSLAHRRAMSHLRDFRSILLLLSGLFVSCGPALRASLVLDDPLQNSTTGTRAGGTFVT